MIVWQIDYFAFNKTGVGFIKGIVRNKSKTCWPEMYLRNNDQESVSVRNNNDNLFIHLLKFFHLH